MSGQQPAFGDFVAKRTLLSVYVTDSTAQNGTGQDTAGFQTYCALVTFGDVTASAAETITIKLQDSATVGGTYADITGATTGAVLVEAAMDNTQRVIYGSCKTLANRWVRAVSTLSAVTTKMQVSVVLLLGGGPSSTVPTTAYTAAVAV